MLCGFCQGVQHIILKAVAVPQVYPVPFADLLQGSVQLFVAFFGEVDRLRVMDSLSC